MAGKGLVHDELPEPELDLGEYTVKSVLFTANMHCLSTACASPVVVLGWAYYASFDNKTHTWPPDLGGETEDDEFVALYEPRFILPSLPIFPIPQDCPQEISVELQGAFSLYWCDSAAAANRVRTVLEWLCDHFQIPREELSASRKPWRLGLADRLRKLGDQRTGFAGLLGEVKWLGDLGSHGGRLDDQDLLDAFEVVEHVLDELFVQRAQRAAEAAERIQKKRSANERSGG